MSNTIRMAQYSRSIVPPERYGVIPTLIMNDTVMRFSHSRGRFILMLEGNCSPHRLNVGTVTPDLTTLALHGCIAAATKAPWLAVVLQGASDISRVHCCPSKWNQTSKPPFGRDQEAYPDWAISLTKPTDNARSSTGVTQRNALLRQGAPSPSCFRAQS